MYGFKQYYLVMSATLLCPCRCGIPTYRQLNNHHYASRQLSPLQPRTTCHPTRHQARPPHYAPYHTPPHTPRETGIHSKHFVMMVATFQFNLALVWDVKMMFRKLRRSLTPSFVVYACSLSRNRIKPRFLRATLIFRFDLRPTGHRRGLSLLSAAVK
jgi:hypothetical protein